jgi:hypothetical protein
VVQRSTGERGRSQRGALRVVRKRPGKGRATEPLESRAEYVEGRERIGDREGESRRFFDAEGQHTCTRYGPLREEVEGYPGAAYLCHSERTGRWWIESHYRDTIIERQLSRRTRRRLSSKTEWETYLLELAIGFWHTKLADDPMHRVAGDSGRWRRIIRSVVTKAVRDLDTAPIDQLKRAISAVRIVRHPANENHLVLLAILAACRAHRGVPYRSEVLALLGDDVPIGRGKSTWNERLASLGFWWLPGGWPRNLKVRVHKIHAV